MFGFLVKSGLILLGILFIGSVASGMSPVEVLSGTKDYILGEDSDDIEIETIEKGSNSSVKTQKNVVINSESEWITEIDDDVPDVDFNEYTVIGVFAGEKVTHSFEYIEITNIVEESDRIVVTIQEYTAEIWGEEEMTQYPCHIVKIDKTEKEIVFE